MAEASIEARVIKIDEVSLFNGITELEGSTLFLLLSHFAYQSPRLLGEHSLTNLLPND